MKCGLFESGGREYDKKRGDGSRKGIYCESCEMLAG